MSAHESAELTALDDLNARLAATDFSPQTMDAAALHAVDYKAVGLGDYGKEGHYVGRQIARWTRQCRESTTGDQRTQTALEQPRECRRVACVARPGCAL